MSTDTGGGLAHRGTHDQGVEWTPDQVESGPAAGSTTRAMAGPLARGLGWFSIGLGIAQILAPDRVAKLVGLPASERTLMIMRAMGLREITHGVGILTSSKPSGWVWSRVAGDALDIGLLAGAGRGDGSNKARVGAALAAVAGTTAADIFDSIKLKGADEPVSFSVPMRVKAAVTINRSADELYRYWHDFENLPTFMAHLESVHVFDDGHSRWTASAPFGSPVTWDARISEDVPGETIAWETEPGADVANSGRVTFRPAPGDRGTELHVELCYYAPGGPLGSALAKVVGEDPVQQVKDDLRRFKQIMETGHLTRSDGAPMGTHAKFQPKQLPAQPHSDGE